MPRRRFSISTLAGEEFVAWLAAAGELAYTPHIPPERDYYFQYSWIIPGIFSSDTNARRHFWFGSPWKDSPGVRLLFAFWNRARDGVVDELFLSNGIAGPLDVKAPLGIYCQPGLHPSMPESLIAIQHGSLQDSVTSFNGVHCNVSRTETGYFNDQTFLLGKLCAVAGLDPNKLEVIDCVGCSVGETCV